MSNNLLNFALYLHMLTELTVLFYIWHKIINGIRKNSYNDSLLMGRINTTKILLQNLTKEQLSKQINTCPNCHAAILDNGKCTNNYTYCDKAINLLKKGIAKEKEKRGIE